MRSMAFTLRPEATHPATHQATALSGHGCVAHVCVAIYLSQIDSARPDVCMCELLKATH